MKDNIRYSDCLSSEIKRKGADKKAVARGLYGEVSFYSVLNGKTLPDYMKRNRLMERLGVVSDLYEDYLQNSEYKIWEKCERIILLIEEHNYDESLKAISEVERINTNKLMTQLLLDMRSRCIFAKNGYSQTGLALIQEARRITVPDYKMNEIDKLLFSYKEVYLILKEIEYKFHLGDISVDECYEKIINVYKWVMTSFFDLKGKVKIVPAISSICKDLYDKCDVDKREIILEVSNEALYELRSTNRLYYYREVLELVIKASKDLGVNNRIDECSHWLEVFNNLYVEYGISYDMNDSAYIYLDSVKNSIGKIIKSRRKAFGLTQSELAEGVCSPRTVSRLENGLVDSQNFDVCGLLHKLNVQTEYRRSVFVEEESEWISLYDKYSQAINNKELDKANALVNKLLDKVTIDSVYNKQAIMRLMAVVNYQNRKISNKEYSQRLREALELTISQEMVAESPDLYLTLTESICLYSMAKAARINGDVSLLDIIYDRCQSLKKERLVYNNLIIYVSCIDWLSGYFIENKKVELGRMLAEEDLILNLRNMFLRQVHRSIVKKVAADVYDTGELFDKQYDGEYQKAITTAKFGYDSYSQKAYEENLYKIKNRIRWDD